MFYAPLFCAEPVYSIKTYSFIYIDSIYNVYIFIPRSTYLHLQNNKFLFQSRIKNNRLLLLKVFMCTKTRTIYITAAIMQYITHTTQSIVYACGLLPIAYKISVCVYVRERLHASIHNRMQDSMPEAGLRTVTIYFFLCKVPVLVRRTT